MADHDRIYYAQRAAEEMKRAEAADHPDVARAHALMTRRYLERASIGDRPGAVPDEDQLFGDNRTSFSRILSEG